MFNIRRGVAHDAPSLTSLMHSSSAYSGSYASILEGYSITPEQIEGDLLYAAEACGEIVGFYSLIFKEEPELDLLFVSDRWQRTGLGAALFAHMRTQAKRRGVASIRIVSHPPSVGFYKRMGAEVIGLKSCSHKVPWERPILTLSL